jgi:fatty-acyl-CoA synthase
MNYKDLAVIPYTSGTTGRAKGCVHTHESVQANITGGSVWARLHSSSVNLSVLPWFHVTGMVFGMHIPIYIGATMVILTRWQRELAAKYIEQFQITHWINISTMVIDFLAYPNRSNYNLSSLQIVAGGGAPLPKVIGEKLKNELGLEYIEGYGLSETMAQSHFNPIDRPKLQCAGLPQFGTDARVIHPDTFEELGPHEEGEIIVHGPQVFQEYWRQPEETKKAFI